MNIEIKSELADNQQVDKDENLSRQFLNISYYTLLEDIPEILSEWWSSTRKDLHTFLEDEGFLTFIDEKTFIEVLTGKYYFSKNFLLFIREKIPYNISLEKLYRHNKNFIKENIAAEELKTDDNLVITQLKEIYRQKKEKRLKSIENWHLEHPQNVKIAAAKYRRTHKEEIKESKRKYRETHKEEIRAYKESRREKENEQQRLRYHADIEKSRAQSAAYSKIYYQNHRTEILEKQAQYRLEHREEINERAQKRMEDEQYHTKIREKGRAYYQKNAKEIQEKRKQQRLQNLEQVKSQEREYGRVYRAKHKEEINARNRASYQENLLENRKINAEKQRKYRNKKRFQTETGKMIMPLLNAIMLSKNEHIG